MSDWTRRELGMLVRSQEWIFRCPVFPRKRGEGYLSFNWTFRGVILAEFLGFVGGSPRVIEGVIESLVYSVFFNHVFFFFRGWRWLIFWWGEKDWSILHVLWFPISVWVARVVTVTLLQYYTSSLSICKYNWHRVNSGIQSPNLSTSSSGPVKLLASYMQYECII